ncbi:hypothetical protein BCEP27_70178 [Burkholderia cepacia]
MPTNRVASTLDEATELIEWYRARWEIDILFNVPKNDCQVEELQLDSIERLERALALFLVVAWRVTHLMRLGRTCPDLDPRLFFDPDEIGCVLGHENTSICPTHAQRGIALGRTPRSFPRSQERRRTRRRDDLEGNHESSYRRGNHAPIARRR